MAGIFRQKKKGIAAHNQSDRGNDSTTGTCTRGRNGEKKNLTRTAVAGRDGAGNMIRRLLLNVAAGNAFSITKRIVFTSSFISFNQQNVTEDKNNPSPPGGTLRLIHSKKKNQFQQIHIRPDDDKRVQSAYRLNNGLTNLNCGRHRVVALVVHHPERR